jgi:glucose 1-dehydrogenase
MKCLATIPGSTIMELIDRPEPKVITPTDIKMKVLQVGICGTDREEAAGGRAEAPDGRKELIIGHEMFGQVTEVGKGVKKAKKGDYGVFMVRRPCGTCESCRLHRADMCLTGNYKERGIKALDGFQQEYVMDDQAFFVKVPARIKHLGVLTEPTSVSEKAIDEALLIQCARIPGAKYKTWLKGKKVLVVGIGPIGLLAAVILQLRGANVYGLDIQDETTIRPTLLKQLGGTYIDGRKQKTSDIDTTYTEFDMILEATGVAQLEFDLIDALGINGIYVLTGIPSGDRPVTVDGGGNMLQQLVLKNQVVFGSVNASIKHFENSIKDIDAGHKAFPEVMNQIITDRHPYTQFADALGHHGPNEIKCVLEW